MWSKFGLIISNYNLSSTGDNLVLISYSAFNYSVKRNVKAYKWNTNTYIPCCNETIMISELITEPFKTLRKVIGEI